ncbi:AmpG family muropeptide MFS transporter [Suttonella ornithocola]|uniref:Muropeptide transporter n=1 Tax=Suttonella ornithocola TaxID=279832 RepID=A0A380MQN1_9GAMM|nr:AmpG family muropeptide MFS transporter [Suttonella ornithocola]SUO94474.1 muropeptide transporter [Suttonella ornithocola]
MTNQPLTLRQALYSRKMLICVFGGFSSGLPLFIGLNLLPVWFHDNGLNLKSIAAFSLAGLPYTWKFLFAPFLDAIGFGRFGRRRGWILLTQLCLLAFIAAFGLTQPQLNLHTIVFLAISMNFFSALQDIALDAFRREILTDAELGLGNAIHINAYRLAQLVPGALAVFLADHISWSSVFYITALFMLPGIFMTLVLAKEPPLPDDRPRTLQDTVIQPFKEFFQRKGVKNALFVLLFIFLYKLGDSMATALQSPFILDMGYSKTDIALVVKNATLWPGVIGTLLGGAWMVKLGINRSLWVFGFLQVITILGYAWLASYGHFESIHTSELSKLAIVIVGEYFSAGLGTAAFVAYIASQTHPAYTATQFALFTSLAAIPRTVVNAVTGALIEGFEKTFPIIGHIHFQGLGYEHFFYLCFFLALPGLIILTWIAPWKAPTLSD